MLLVRDCALLSEEEQSGLRVGDVDIAFNTEACRRGDLSEPIPNTPVWDMDKNAVGLTDQTNGGLEPVRGVHTIDFDGFVRTLLHLACRKFTESSSEVEALDKLVAGHLLSNAKRSQTETSSESRPAGDDEEVAEVFSHFAKDLKVFFDCYACPVMGEKKISKESYFRFVKDFGVLPRLTTRREAHQVFKSVCGDEAGDFEHFIDCVIEQATLGFGKDIFNDAYPTSSDKAKAMIMQLTTSQGRVKCKIPINKYAAANYAPAPPPGRSRGKSSGSKVLRAARD